MTHCGGEGSNCSRSVGVSVRLIWRFLLWIRSTKEDSKAALRELTGVLRIGIIAKGLILTGDDHIDLVMLCSGKPTMSLLTKVVSLLPEQLKVTLVHFPPPRPFVRVVRLKNTVWMIFCLPPQEVSKDSVEYIVTPKASDAAILISTCPSEETEKKVMVKVTLTSTVIREEILAVTEKPTPIKEEAGTEDESATLPTGGAAATVATAVAAGGEYKICTVEVVKGLLSCIRVYEYTRKKRDASREVCAHEEAEKDKKKRGVDTMKKEHSGKIKLKIIFFDVLI